MTLCVRYAYRIFTYASVNMIKLRFDFMLLLFDYYGMDGIQSQSLLGSWITKSPRDYDALLLVLLLF